MKVLCTLMASTTSLSKPVRGRSIVKGQVVDAETGEPIEGAAVFIEWTKPSAAPPGVTAIGVMVEKAENLTDEKGLFDVPRYASLYRGKKFTMAVYKKGYVCWSSETIFPTYEKRKGFKLTNHMIIQLERFKDDYSRLDHANFAVISSADRDDPGLFQTAIESEMEFGRDVVRKKRMLIHSNGNEQAVALH